MISKLKMTKMLYLLTESQVERLREMYQHIHLHL